VRHRSKALILAHQPNLGGFPSSNRSPNRTSDTGDPNIGYLRLELATALATQCHEKFN
jgi:hypothetical protein